MIFFNPKTPLFKMSKNVQSHYMISQQNLDISSLLFEHEYYPYALYHLQQAIENGFKCYGEFSQSLSPDDKKKTVGHKGHIINDSINKKTLNKFITETKKQINPENYPKYEKGFLQFMKSPEFQPLTHEVHKIKESKITQKKLDNLLKTFSDFNLNFQNQRDYYLSKQFEEDDFIIQLTNDKFVKQMVVAFITHDTKFNSLQPDEWMTYLIENKVSFRNPIIAWLYMQYIMDSFSALSLLLEDPQQQTRYPNSKGIRPDELYDEKHPFIKKFSEIFKYSDIAIKNLGYFIQAHVNAHNN